MQPDDHLKVWEGKKLNFAPPFNNEVTERAHFEKCWNSPPLKYFMFDTERMTNEPDPRPPSPTLALFWTFALPRPRSPTHALFWTFALPCDLLDRSYRRLHSRVSRLVLSSWNTNEESRPDFSVFSVFQAKGCFEGEVADKRWLKRCMTVIMGSCWRLGTK